MGSVQIPRTLAAYCVGLLLALMSGEGGADMYSNSFISPNSAEEVGVSLQFDESQARLIDPTKTPGAVNEETSSSNSKIESGTVAEPNNRVLRSAVPILSKTTAGDNLLLYKNVEDAFESNDVELSGRLGHIIQPSRTDRDRYFGGLQATSVPVSGEAKGALQGRSLQEPQEITPTATTTASATHSVSLEKARQANPDIQDILTGLVKLLHGNVKVQTNTAPPGSGRPLRPVSTRINNRGPPRITDVPALPPDFDIPAPPLPPPPAGPMSTQPPYPFDLPLNNMSPKRPTYVSSSGGNNIPLSSDQLPLGNKRPVFYRPTTRLPWNKRRPVKRPNPDIPHYKPMPPMSQSDIVSLTSERPNEDILTFTLGSQFEGTHSGDEYMEQDSDFEDTKVEGVGANQNESNPQDEATTNQNTEDITDFEKSKEKIPRPEKSTKVTLVTPTMKSEMSILETRISLVTEETSASLTSISIEPTSVLKDVIPSTQAAVLAPSSVLNSSEAQIEKVKTDSPILESSMMESTSSSVSSSVATPTITTASPETAALGAVNSTETTSTNNRVSSTIEPSSVTSDLSSLSTSSESYRPRPGIVIDDPDYKPGGLNRQPILTRPPLNAYGDTFEVTISAIQGQSQGEAAAGQPYVIPVDLDHINGHGDVITAAVGNEGYVSIEGTRTYLNLFGENPDPTSVAAVGIKPTAPSNNQVVHGTALEGEKPVKSANHGSVKPAQRRPSYRPRPQSQSPVRIDTCIVGDDSTCDVSQHEICRTEAGVSACHCRPGTARRKHRDPCRKIVAVLVSLRVDRIYEKRVVWANELLQKTSEGYEQLSFEAERALDSAMSMTPFSDEFLGAKVNNIYQGDRSQGQAGVFVNITLQLEENAETSRPSIKGDIQKHLLGVIQRRSNNVGYSALWVDSPPGSVSGLQDLDECASPELHDCHAQADCINTFGSFKCECHEGLKDPWFDNKHRAGRFCEQCPASHCNNRGECKFSNGQEVCTCVGNYYGNQCELDGEVLGVAIGASVAAIIIIGLTLVCLVMWSRKWSREQKAAVGSPVFGYMATASNTVKTPVMGAPPYQLTLEDRLRWAQIADVMAQANHYAPEPGLAPTRPSSALFGYPTLPVNNTLSRHSIYGGAAGTLPPVPLPRLNLQAQLASKAASVQSMKHLDNSSSSEEEDKIDLLGRNFHVPRPKSRSSASVANQSGIYYDVDYDQNEMYKPSGIPMKVLTGIGGCRLSKNDTDYWLYDAFKSQGKRDQSPTTSL